MITSEWSDEQAFQDFIIERLRFGEPLQVGLPQLIDLPLNFVQLLLEGV